MRNKIVTIMICALTTLALVSCDDSTEGYTRITYYPTITILGESVEAVLIGSTYVDAGVTVMEGDNDITSSVVTTSNVNTSVIGVYSVTYSAKNVDGFSSSVKRTVYVHDESNMADISGTYKVADGSYRQHATAGKTNFAGYNVTVNRVAPGIFYCSDYYGGYYEQRAGYGSAYAMSGCFKLNGDNSITVLTGSITPWGDSYDGLDNAKYDADNETIYWELRYAGSMTFFLTFDKQ